MNVFCLFNLLLMTMKTRWIPSGLSTVCLSFDLLALDVLFFLFFLRSSGLFNSTRIMIFIDFGRLVFFANFNKDRDLCENKEKGEKKGEKRYRGVFRWKIAESLRGCFFFLFSSLPTFPTLCFSFPSRLPWSIWYWFILFQVINSFHLGTFSTAILRFQARKKFWKKWECAFCLSARLIVFVWFA